MKMQIAFVIISFDELIGPDIPDHYRPATVLPLWDYTFKIDVAQRVVLGWHREPFLALFIWRSLWHCPGLQRVVHFQTEVVMKMTGSVLLNHESPRTALPAS